MALALGSRRSTIAALFSAVAALAVALAVGGRSCGVDEPGPEVTVRDLLQAAKAEDVDTIYELLSPATRTRLEDEARRATDYVGAATRYTAKDLISVGRYSDVPRAIDLLVLEQTGERAVVLVVSGADRDRISLVRVNGAWKIDMPDFPSPQDSAR